MNLILVYFNTNKYILNIFIVRQPTSHVSWGKFLFGLTLIEGLGEAQA